MEEFESMSLRIWGTGTNFLDSEVSGRFEKDEQESRGPLTLESDAYALRSDDRALKTTTTGVSVLDVLVVSSVLGGLFFFLKSGSGSSEMNGSALRSWIPRMEGSWPVQLVLDTTAGAFETSSTLASMTTL